MENASFHRSEGHEKIRTDVGVKLVYLPPYSPDLNPIEEFSAELKVFIRRNWDYYEKIRSEDLVLFLNGASMWSMRKKRVLRGYFRHAENIEDFDARNPF
jgi:transposase